MNRFCIIALHFCHVLFFNNFFLVCIYSLCRCCSHTCIPIFIYVCIWPYIGSSVLYIYIDVYIYMSIIKIWNSCALKKRPFKAKVLRRLMCMKFLNHFVWFTIVCIALSYSRNTIIYVGTDTHTYTAIQTLIYLYSLKYLCSEAFQRECAYKQL